MKAWSINSASLPKAETMKLPPSGGNRGLSRSETAAEKAAMAVREGKATAES